MRDCASGELPRFRVSSMDKEKGRRREAFRGRAVRNDAPGSGEVLPSCFGAGEKAPVRLTWHLTEYCLITAMPWKPEHASVPSRRCHDHRRRLYHTLPIGLVKKNSGDNCIRRGRTDRAQVLEALAVFRAAVLEDSS